MTTPAKKKRLVLEILTPQCCSGAGVGGHRSVLAISLSHSVSQGKTPATAQITGIKRFLAFTSPLPKSHM